MNKRPGDSTRGGSASRLATAWATQFFLPERDEREAAPTSTCVEYDRWVITEKDESFCADCGLVVTPETSTAIYAAFGIRRWTFLLAYPAILV